VSVGIDDLLQTVLWVAEEKALMANPNKLAAGTVIEAHLDKKRGPVATLLVQVCCLLLVLQILQSGLPTALQECSSSLRPLRSAL
jgi:hypothetical protein